MRREVIRVTGDIVQITLPDERWYEVTVGDKTELYPSISWISEHYPKGIAFFKWLANTGWDEAELIKREAGEKGSMVHYIIHLLLAGRSISMDEELEDPETGDMREPNGLEWEAVKSFMDWWKLADVRKVYFREKTVVDHKLKMAGTLDLLALCGEPQKDRGQVSAMPGLNLLDFKTSQDVWPSHKVQITLYEHCLVPSISAIVGPLAKEVDISLGILQVGYQRNKRKWKYNLIEPDMDLAMATHTIWKREAKKDGPKQIEFPRTFAIPRPQLGQAELSTGYFERWDGSRHYRGETHAVFATVHRSACGSKQHPDMRYVEVSETLEESAITCKRCKNLNFQQTPQQT